MWEFIEIILYVLFVGLTVCPLIAIYWFFNSRAHENYYPKHKTICAAIYIMSFFSAVLMIFQMLRIYMFFIPEKWGSYDENGEFQPYNFGIAILLVLLAFFLIVYLFSKAKKLINENRELKNQRFI